MDRINDKFTLFVIPCGFFFSESLRHCLALECLLIFCMFWNSLAIATIAACECDSKALKYYFFAKSEIFLMEKYHNAPGMSLTMYHFVREMCTCVNISVINWCIVGYLCNVLWDFWAGFINERGLSILFLLVLKGHGNNLLKPTEIFNHNPFLLLSVLQTLKRDVRNTANK